MRLTMFDPAPIGVMATEGPEHRLAYTNEVYRKTFGDRPLGLTVREAFPDLAQCGYFDILDRVYATGTAEVLTSVPLDLAFADRADRGRRYFSFSISHATMSDGRQGVLGVIVEVTDQVTGAERIRVLSEERQRALLRYRSLVNAGSQVVWVTGPMGGVTEPSPGWERVTGQSWEEFRGDGWIDAVHPDDRARVAEAWHRALTEVTPRFTHAYRLRQATGGYRHFAVEAAPVRDGDRVIEWVGTCTDVEQEWQESRREELLARAAAATADLVRPDEMLAALAGVIVPDLADNCTIYLLPQALHRLPGTALTAERVAAATREGLPGLPPDHEEHLRPGSPLARAADGRRPVHAVFPPGSPPPDLAPPDAEPWLACGANSVVLLPVVVDGTTAALVTASVCGDRTPLGAADIGLLQTLLERTHTPLSNALEYQRTRQVALALQQSLLTDPPDVPDLTIAVRYRPSTSAAEVGGDWYDSFPLRDGATVLTIGDVSGHDLPAAVTMGQLRNMLRGLTLDRREPTGTVLRRLDIAVQTLYLECTATCVLARVERPAPGRFQLTYSVAGHPPPLLVEADGAARFLTEARSPLLGLDPQPEYASVTEPLLPGATLLLYTDGLVERRAEDITVGLERLRRHASAAVRRPLEAFCDELLAELLTVDGDDDVAMVAVRLPAPPA
ncbi:SpoIIE family protein phosphatase [Streptomyces sp. DH24]|uniref:SpoIIE family protein phosphatase n=1 Tax=Streptomyces sp. DH24 TaxID=3040123 RepID=UPI0024413D57|nr:SpoIIE family protein phosphatase [Streptomyces sp. DH24]MDG9717890.1 SpoIIE family protein phosphatase [Streptomyces sp. DH24]